MSFTLFTPVTQIIVYLIIFNTLRFQNKVQFVQYCVRSKVKVCVHITILGVRFWHLILCLAWIDLLQWKQFLFVCLVFFVPLVNFSHVTIAGERLQIFDLCSTLVAVEQWVFFNVLYLLLPGPTLYHDRLRVPMTLTRVAERLAVELSLPVLTTQVCGDWGSNPYLPHARRTLYLYDTAAVSFEFECSLCLHVW